MGRNMLLRATDPNQRATSKKAMDIQDTSGWSQEETASSPTSKGKQKSIQ